MKILKKTKTKKKPKNKYKLGNLDHKILFSLVYSGNQFWPCLIDAYISAQY